MHPRVIFTLLLFLIVGLLRIIGFWRRKAGEAACAAAKRADNEKERDRYCRLAVLDGHYYPSRYNALLSDEQRALCRSIYQFKPISTRV